ncbi:uncharacterized protein FIBRA_03089 [Fibroporia radiculosa]|uniref:Bola-like protein n=1 Tax=Fibroporia radiculosa TaxID=599839 RepID=J4I9E9_9APHY|nr:uncharacterized protein FIBRA_03089 [Fibroporia radiculosa]CCM01041.1 predicted protein [Fibroporia radiculosa]
MFSVALVRRLAGTRVPLLARGYVAAPQNLSEGENTIYAKLTEKFSPSELQVQDVSGGCGTFYQIIIASEAFKGVSTVKQHRMVNEVLKKEIEGIHGLQASAFSPSSCTSDSTYKYFSSRLVLCNHGPTEQVSSKELSWVQSTL